MVKVIIDKEKIRDMLFVCGIEEMEIMASLFRERIDNMLKKVVDAIRLYENDPYLKDAKKALDVMYETKERIRNIIG
ncbi:hypothetical protein LCGC14_2351350 [marine sediment metagenome]|uniref:Uncharacterized protein n=1 Tax=marine sediment metagenome TaxID=412755 RepID=A0A0F9F467_9ZZZZ